jgi:hypothetical protein
MCRAASCSQAAGDRLPLVISLPAGELDPRAELEALARRLIGVTEADPQNTAAAKALVDVLRAIPPLPEELDPVERLQAEVAARDAADHARRAMDSVPKLPSGESRRAPFKPGLGLPRSRGGLEDG